MNRRKKLIRYLVPSVLSAVSIFLFTIVDGIFVGRGVGADGLGAVNLAFPFIMIFTAVLMLAMVGGLTITAIRIGRGDTKGASEVFSLAVLISFGVCVLFTLFGTLGCRQVVRLLGANETFEQLTVDYLFWYSVFLLPCGFCTVLNGFCRNDGAPGLVSAGTVVSTSLNIFGDWLFIFPLDMGLRGAAIATGLAQTAGFCVVLSHFLRKKGVLRFSWPRWNPGLLARILLRGLPECAAQFSVPLSTILTNIVIIRMLGDAELNVYSLICYAACFTVAVFLGTSEGVQPLLGRSYGAGDRESLKYYFRSALWIGFTGSLILFFVIWALWGDICLLFGVDGAVLDKALAAYPQYSWGFVVQSFGVIIGGYLYSTTRTKEALIINLCRSFLANTAVILFVPRLFGGGSIWYTFGIYESLCALLSFFLLYRSERRGTGGRAAE